VSIDGGGRGRPRRGSDWLGWACGSCEHCTSGWKTLCLQQRNTGYSVDGGYAEYVRASAAFVGRVPDSIDPLDAAPLTCAGVTADKAVKVRGARSSDVTDDKLQLAKELGAEYTVNAAQEDPVEAIQRLGGADAAIALAAAPKPFEQAFQSLRRRGRLVFVGLPADNVVALPIVQTVLNSITVSGSIVGRRVDLAETFELHADGRTRVVRETPALESVNAAFAEVLSSQARSRLVFDLH
jgi:propanol-preferring alcohol dehydrogenase